MLEIKKVSHTEYSKTLYKVYFEEEYLGYYTKNTSKFAVVDENFNFSSKCDKIEYFRTKTKDEIIQILEKQIKKEPVTLLQHFGIIKTLNND